jgi:hypothetical protein
LGFIRVGYIEKFRGVDSLLLDADVSGLGDLLSWVRAVGDNRAPQDFTQLKTLHAYGRLNVKAEVSEVDTGLVREADGSFVWRRTPRGWADVEAKLDVLLQSATGHQYLDASADTVVPIASIGEYSDQWWQERAG